MTVKDQIFRKEHNDINLCSYKIVNNLNQQIHNLPISFYIGQLITPFTKNICLTKYSPATKP